MKKVFIGIDISKNWLDFAKRKKGDLLSTYIGRFDNSVKEIEKQLDKLIAEFERENLWICFEHTGSYGLLLSTIIEEKNIPYSAVPAMEIKRLLGITRGKDDEVDSKRIAEYADIHSHKLVESNLPGEELLEIKQILTYRSQLVKVKTQFKNSKKEHEITAKVTEAKYITKGITKQIDKLEKEITGLEKKISMLIKKKPEIKNNYNFITSVKGIGEIIGANMMVATMNFTAFKDARKFNCYTGLAPFEESSGTSKKKSKTSNLANKKLKTLMFNGVNSAIVWDPQLKRYYNKKRKEGKEENSVKNAVACKLVARMFATVKRQSKFVVLQN